MLSPRWRKVLRDLWGNKIRTLLVVLSIAVGVFAIGMIAGSRVILLRDVAAAYAASSPSSATLYTAWFDDDLVQVVRHMPGVREAEGRHSIGARLKIGPDEWRPLQLSAIPDYDAIRVNKLRPVSGAWPPPDRELLLERSSLGYVNAKVGDTILIETPDRKQRQIRIAGLAHDLNQIPAFWSGTANGYITLDTLEWLGEPRNYNELNIVVTANNLDKAHIQRIADKVGDKVEKSGRTVYWTLVPEPGRHWSNDNLQAMILLLGVLGLLALLLSGFLVVNTISALLTQQIRQIGIMKAVGARAGQITGMYLGTVLIFGLLALLVAVPLGVFGAYAFAGYTAGLLNFDIENLSISPDVLALEVAAGLAVPLVAALYPVIAGTRITVRAAVSGYGLGKGHYGRSRLDRLIGRIRFLSRPLLLSLRNTFRRKGRLALTLTTLTLGGAIFIGVVCVRDSLLITLDDAFKYWNYDVEVNFNRAYRSAYIEHEALRVPGAVKAESWAFSAARRQRADGSESANIMMIALPAATDMLQPTLLQGRWLLPADENALVINTDLLRDEPDINVNDAIVFKMGDRETTWRVVGLVKGVLAGPYAYANYPYLTNVIGEVGRAGRVQVITAQHDAAFQSSVTKALEAHFEQIGLRVNSTETTATNRARVELQFDIIVVFLMVMAILLAVVGGIGLMGTMSINVLERTREIGVMRAIGAADGTVMRIVVVEGILIGVTSWIVGVILAIPLSMALSNVVGTAFLRAPLSYTFSLSGAALWLIIVVVLAALASILPAWNASRVSVRDVLAYE
jgi:putative ABC transport system permease protein